MGWADDEFDTIHLGDARLNRRAATLAEAFADQRFPASKRVVCNQ